MTRLPVLVAALALAGCGATGLSPVEQARRCSDLADAVARAHLTTTPSEQLARQVADSLDNSLSRLGAAAVHDPAVRLHAHLHAVEKAQARGDSRKADLAAAAARVDIADLSEACALAPSRFLGG